MNIPAIRAFCALVDTGSFHAAAESIHRSQPAITQQVRSLETELAAPLWDRASGAPTEAGHMLYLRGREILSRVDGLHNELRDAQSVAPRQIRIGTSDTHALYLLPQPLRDFRKAWPETQLHILSRSSKKTSWVAGFQISFRG